MANKCVVEMVKSYIICQTSLDAKYNLITQNGSGSKKMKWEAQKVFGTVRKFGLSAANCNKRESALFNNIIGQTRQKNFLAKLHTSENMNLNYYVA